MFVIHIETIFIMKEIGEEEKIYQILERKLWDDPNRVSLYFDYY